MFLLRLLLCYVMLSSTIIGCVSFKGGDESPLCAKVLADFHNDTKYMANLVPTVDNKRGLFAYAAIDMESQVVHVLCLSATTNNMNQNGCKAFRDMTQTCKVSGIMFLYYKSTTFTVEEAQAAQKQMKQKPDQVY